MKKIVGFFVVLVISLYALFSAAKHFWRGETLSVTTTCQKWRDKPFDAATFKKSDESHRAEMACALLKGQKKFVGLDVLKVRELFGDPDGFYFRDSFPAYLITPAKSADQDSWQLVFLLDRKDAVSEIIVHKNCCDR